MYNIFYIIIIYIYTYLEYIIIIYIYIYVCSIQEFVFWHLQALNATPYRTTRGQT